MYSQSMPETFLSSLGIDGNVELEPVYWPHNPLSNLGRALFFVAHAWHIKWMMDRGVDTANNPYARGILNFYEQIEMSWPKALLVKRLNESNT